MDRAVSAFRLLRAALIAVLTLAGPALADGLGRFEQELKPKLGPELSLSYGSASALGQSGFVLNDVKAIIKEENPDAAATPLAIRRIVVEDFDFDHATGPDGPYFAKMRFESVSSPEIDEALKAFGVTNATADIAIDFRFDPGRKVMTLNRLEFLLPGLARLEFSAIVDGVTPSAAAAAPDKAMDEVTLRTATLVFEDSSLLSKLIPALAADEGKTPEAYIAESVGLLGVLAEGQGQRTMAVLDALVSFSTDFKQPKGPLRITVSPPAGVSFKDTDKLTVANALVDVFGISATYAGTRAGAALAAAPKDAPAQSAALPRSRSAVACKPGERLFALSDGGWWSATVREPSPKASGQCIVRFDGTDASEDASMSPKEMLAWSMDGPGRAAARCRKGDRVWKLADGAWYPAKVKQGKGASCVVELEDDDDAEEETVALKQLRVLPR